LESEERTGFRSGRLPQREPHPAIVSISSRRKDYVSLFRKLARKELARSGMTGGGGGTHHVKIGDRLLALPEWTELASPERLLRGRAAVFVQRGQDGTTQASLGGDLRFGGHTARWEPPKVQGGPERLPFCQRVLHPDVFAVDDWAGQRVVCSFLSDIDRILDAIRAHFELRGIKIRDARIQSWQDFAQADGYRAVHLTVRVPLKGLVGQGQYDRLAAIMGPPSLGADPADVCFPCEIQIRTSYQDSWARASHQIQYKHEDVQTDLRQHLQYLSGLLYESDSILDLVRESIEADHPAFVKLLAHLRWRLPRDAFALVHFGAAFARDLHRDNTLYGGRPYFSHLVDVATRLIFSFGVDDPWMLLLAFFHDLWMDDAGQVLDGLGLATENPDDQLPLESIQPKIPELLENRIEGQKVSSLVRRLQNRLPPKWPAHSPDKGRAGAFGVVPSWFCYLLANCLRYWHPDRKKRGDSRLSDFQKEVENIKRAEKKQKEKEEQEKKKEQEKKRKGLSVPQPNGQDATGDEAPRAKPLSWHLEHRGCVLEMAIQLSRLTQLPHDPHRARAVLEFEQIYNQLERIRRWIGGEVRPVLRETERELRATADKLGAYMPIEWEA
jgi:ppGpp synthetase/RelA/SpoT-type nucleotidyltranferase